MKAHIYVYTLVATVCSLLTLATSASAFMSGNQYRELGENTKLTYVLGVLDGWQIVGPMLSKVAPGEQTAVKHFTGLANCAADKHMTGSQIQAIVDKHIADNPSKWHQAMAYLVWEAMESACKK